MSITDELRECANEYSVFAQPSRLLRIADRIDAEHERACKEQFACGAEHGIGASIEASEYQSRGWMKLPVDADGVPIRVGDRIEYLTGGRDIVRFVTLNGDGWMVNERGWKPCTMRHYTPPTVEDVLFDALKHFGAVEEHTPEVDEWLAEYAAKLRLREDK